MSFMDGGRIKLFDRWIVFNVLNVAGPCHNCADIQNLTLEEHAEAAKVPCYVMYVDFPLWQTGDPDHERSVLARFCDRCGLVAAEMQIVAKIEERLANRWKEHLEQLYGAEPR